MSGAGSSGFTARDDGGIPVDGYIKYQSEWMREPCGIPRVVLAELELWRGRMRELGLVGVLPNGIGYGNLSARLLTNDPSKPPAAWLSSSDHAGAFPFWITGSATGGLESLSQQHYARVDAVEIARNWLRATGLTDASSESMTHAAIYGAVPECLAVIHVHSRLLWSAMLDQRVAGGNSPKASSPMGRDFADAVGVVPCTDPAAAYGTPAMARELERLAPLAWCPQRALELAVDESCVEINSKCVAVEPIRGVGMVAMTGHADGVIAFGSDLASVGELLQESVARLR